MLFTHLYTKKEPVPSLKLNAVCSSFDSVIVRRVEFGKEVRVSFTEAGAPTIDEALI